MGSNLLSPGDLPDPGIEPRFPALQADALPSEPPGKPQGKILWGYWNGHINSKGIRNNEKFSYTRAFQFMNNNGYQMALVF